MATDALVLKHQSISIRSADQACIVLEQLDTKILYLQRTPPQTKLRFKKEPVVLLWITRR